MFTISIYEVHYELEVEYELYVLSIRLEVSVSVTHVSSGHSTVGMR